MEEKHFIFSHIFKKTYHEYKTLVEDHKKLNDEIVLKNEHVLDQDSQIEKLTAACRMRDKDISELARACQTKDKDISELARACENKDQEFVKLLDAFRKVDIERTRLAVESNELQKKCSETDRQKTATAFLCQYILESKVLDNMDRFNYDDLHALIEGNEEKNTAAYKLIATSLYENNIIRLKNKPKIKVAFIVTNASIWTCDAIYKKLTDDKRFDPFIIVIPFEYGDDRKIIHQIYKDTYSYFEANGYKCKSGYDIDTERYKSFEEAGSADIVFHLSPHMQHINKNFKVESMPLSVLNIYIPYGIMTVDGYTFQFNQKSHHLFWKIFCETPLHQKMAREHSLVNDFNVICSGYVKMDSFLDASPVPDDRMIWKLPIIDDENNKIIKIIWAPHHALMENTTAFGTFHKNYLFFYELAKNMPNTSWIVKPHPLLKMDSIQFGLFKNSEEYDDYMNKWDELPNARTIHEGSYVDIFKTSDAMILDSVSFLAEYLFVNKPSLFLTRVGDTFNDFGMILKECHYKVEGTDLNGIEEFINDVLIRKNDPKKEIREEFFDKYLNYLNFNGGIMASDYIYKYLADTFAIEK